LAPAFSPPPSSFNPRLETTPSSRLLTCLAARALSSFLFLIYPMLRIDIHSRLKGVSFSLEEVLFFSRVELFSLHFRDPLQFYSGLFFRPIRIPLFRGAPTTPVIGKRGSHGMGSPLPPPYLLRCLPPFPFKARPTTSLSAPTSLLCGTQFFGGPPPPSLCRFPAVGSGAMSVIIAPFSSLPRDAGWPRWRDHLTNLWPSTERANFLRRLRLFEYSFRPRRQTELLYYLPFLFPSLPFPSLISTL